MACDVAKIGDVLIGSGFPLAVIAGPCVIESRGHTIELAGAIKKITDRLSIPFIFKASFDKANRSSVHSFRGPGIEAGLAILAEVREKLGVPVLSDIHEAGQAEAAGAVLDCLQIPASAAWPIFATWTTTVGAICSSSTMTMARRGAGRAAPSAIWVKTVERTRPTAPAFAPSDT